MKFSRGEIYLYRRKQTSSLTGEAWRINKDAEGQETMNSMSPEGRQGAHYTDSENKSQ